MTRNIIFCAYDRPNHIATGPNVWIKRLIPDLISRNINVKTLFIYRGNIDACPTISWFKEHKIPIAALSGVLVPYIEDQIKWLLREIKLFDAEVIIANLMAPAFFTRKYTRNIPVIAVLHSDDPFYRDLLNYFYTPKAKIYLDKLVTISSYHKNIALEYNKNTTIHRIPCGAPVSPKIASYKGGVLKVIYVGRITEVAKQISKLTLSFCSIAQTTPNIEFSIYGDGPEVAKVEEIIADKGAGERVKYFGPINPEDIQEVMSNHHVFTLQSDFEGMPLALMEAMGSGLVPVCLAQNSGIGEVIDDGVNGIIIQNRDEDFSRALNLIYDKPDYWSFLSVNARNTILNDYSIEVTNGKWEELLSSLSISPSRKIKIPYIVNINEIPPMKEGDLRRPPLKILIQDYLKSKWVSFRILVRPRARIRQIKNRLTNK